MAIRNVAGDITLGAQATEQLTKTIEAFNTEASKQTRQMLRLTWVIAALTGLMTIMVAIQIYIAIQ